ncbi:MAG TPA: c-type cytochrome [Burkholderiaceae bacterium]|nr:c-type cytochrome [Burkholderiaceae bacterium]
MILTKRVLLAAAIGAGLTCGAAAQDAAKKVDPARGQKIAAEVCAACHAADGNSTISANPKLAGQHAEYLYKQLVDYTAKPGAKAPARENPVMTGFASQLSDEDKRNVSAWFASQKQRAGVARLKETLDLGQRIYRAGIADKAVPACTGCHSPNGSGIPVQYPRIGGQHAEYMEAQLKAFRDGGRLNNAAMRDIALRLTDREIRAVADYMAGLR